MLGELTAHRGCWRKFVEVEFEVEFVEFVEGEGEFPLIVVVVVEKEEFKEVLELKFEAVSH